MTSPSLLRRVLLIAVGCLLTTSLWLHLGMHVDSSKAEIEQLLSRANQLLKGIQSHHPIQSTHAPCSPSENNYDTEILSLKTQLAATQTSLRDLISQTSGKTANKQATSSSLSSPSKWLVIGMPTVPRPNNEDYLLTSLNRIHEQLPATQNDLLHLRILVHVVHITAADNVQLRHSRFDEAKEKYAESPYFKFSEISSPPQPSGLGLSDLGSANLPGYRVRKQTRDLAVR